MKKNLEELENKYRNIILKDDEAETGGVSFRGETLYDFMLSCDMPLTADEDVINKGLKECGIMPVDLKEFVSLVPRYDRKVYVTRSDYLDMPCPMNASAFTDQQMQALADKIANEVGIYNIDVNGEYFYEEFEDAFWKEMEECAIQIGMEYFEDI